MGRVVLRVCGSSIMRIFRGFGVVVLFRKIQHLCMSVREINRNVSGILLQTAQNTLGIFGTEDTKAAGTIDTRVLIRYLYRPRRCPILPSMPAYRETSCCRLARKLESHQTDAHKEDQSFTFHLTAITRSSNTRITLINRGTSRRSVPLKCEIDGQVSLRNRVPRGSRGTNPPSGGGAN